MPGVGIDSKPEVLIEAAGQVADRPSRPWPTAARCRARGRGWLPVIAAIRSPDGDGSIESTLRVTRLLRVGREVAAVVGRPLLVAERLEALLEVAVELLIPFVRVHVERFLERVVAAADDALAQREDELPDAFLAPARFDELERGVAEVVDQARRCRSCRSPAARTSSGRCRPPRRRGRSSGRSTARCRSCSPTCPRTPTAACSGGSARSG